MENEIEVEDAFTAHMVKLNPETMSELDKISKSEGWAIFNADGVMQIQRIDDPEDGMILSGDGEAYSYVSGRALEGSVPHALALYLDGREDSIEFGFEIYVPKKLVSFM